MREHVVKSEADYFTDLWRRKRWFEIRVNDRGYAVGDKITFREYDRRSGAFSGRQEDRLISFVLLADNRLGLSAGYCALGLVEVTRQE